MIYFTKHLIKDKKELNYSLEKEITLNNLFINNQKYKANLLSSTIQTLSSPSYVVKQEDEEQLSNVLNSYKKSLELSKDNIEYFEKISNLLSSIKQMSEKDISKKFEDFNSEILNINTSILKNNTEILHTLELKLPTNISCSSVSESNNETTKNSPTIIIDNNTTESATPIEEKKEEKLEISTNKPSSPEAQASNNFKENTLIISEKSHKVFLPYYLNTVEELLKNNPNKYSNFENVIEKEYTLPLDQFKSPSISRFKEAYKLVRNKEFGSLKESLDLATELFFNYNLHPAIISACRNLDELDIYLDYLAENETDKFNCFNIEFESLPTIVKYVSKHKMN